MRSARSVTVSAILLVLAGATAAKPPLKSSKLSPKALPKQLPDVANLKLGEPVATFMADFSEEEKNTTVHGLRIFTIKINTMPVGLVDLRCEFLDGKLVYMGAQLDSKVSTEKSWTAFVGPSIAQYGPPKSVTDLLGINRIHGARLDESAAWADPNTVVIYGRDANTPHAYYISIIDAKYLSQTSDALKTEEVEEITAEQTAQRKRSTEALEAARLREANEAEAKRAAASAAAQKEAESKRLIAEKDAEARRLRDEAEKTQKVNQAEANRLREEAEKVKKELADLKAAAEGVRAKKAAEEERARTLREATAQVTVSPVSCGCVTGAPALQIRCHVDSRADVPVRVTISASGSTSFDNGGLNSDTWGWASGMKDISLQPTYETDMEINASIEPQRSCNGAKQCTCSISSVALQ